MKLTKLLICLAVPLAMGGCASFPGTTGYLDELKATAPSGTTFDQALSQEYKAFAESERLQYDWMSSQYFAKKGLKASHGERVAPEALSDWSLNDKEAHAELATQRERLNRILNSSAPQKLPVLTATAQVKFDCWVEQEHEGWQEGDIVACRTDFMAAAHEIESRLSLAPVAASNAQNLFFDFNDAKLPTEARMVIPEIAEAIRGAGYPVVTVIGHTDAVGSSVYNLALSERRAQSVKRALVAAGIPAEKIVVRAEGKSDPLVKAADGAREPQNRRVEIRFGE